MKSLLLSKAKEMFDPSGYLIVIWVDVKAAINSNVIWLYYTFNLLSPQISHNWLLMSNNILS